MAKTKVLTALTVSTMILASAGAVLADDNVTIGDDNITVEVTTEETGIVVEPVQPTEAETTDVKETEGVAIGDDNVTVPTTTEETGIVVDPTQPTEPTTTTAATETSQSTEIKNQTTKPSTKNEVKPTLEEVFTPFETDTGVTVVGTNEGVVTVVNAAGETVSGTAESFGGTTNKNGTVTFKTSNGKMETLPATGENDSVLMKVAGIVIIGLLAIFGSKSERLRDLFSRFKKK